MNLDAFMEWGEDAGIATSDDSTADVRGAIIRICRQNTEGVNKNSALALAVVEALQKRGHFYYVDTSRNFGSAMYFDSAAKVLHTIASDVFRAWLSSWISINRADRSFSFIMAQVETAATSGDQTVGITPENYWARREGAIYVSNGDGKVVKITASGLEETDNGTDGVLFSCGRTLRPWQLTTPEDPFESCDLFADLNCSAEHGKVLFKLWFMSLPSNPTNKPPLALAGAIGSGKTRAAQGVAEFFGVPFNAVKASEKGESDFWCGVNQGGLFTLDNVDSRIGWVPDTLAACSTGVGSVRRKLYTNSDTATLKPNAWIAITSANPEYAGDAGLADRLMVVRLDRRVGGTDDSKLSDQIAAKRNAGISFIVHALVRALADRDPVPKELNSRHPDFAEFAVRIGRAIGIEKESLAALRAAEGDKARFCIENDAFGSALSKMVIEQKVVEGNAEEIGSQVKCADFSSFPQLTTRGCAKRLRAVWPHLQGIFDTATSIRHGGALYYRIAVRDRAGASLGDCGDCGDCEEAVSIKPPMKEESKRLPENTVLESPQSPPGGARRTSAAQRLSMLDDDTLDMIKADYISRKEPVPALAKKYRLTPTLLYKLAANGKWTPIPEPFMDALKIPALYAWAGEQCLDVDDGQK